MTRATEKWKERVRQQADAGPVPMSSARRLLRPTRQFLLATLGIAAALVAFASYAGRASAPEAPSVQAASPTVVPAEPQPGKKRSFTARTTADAHNAGGAPTLVSPEPPPSPIHGASAPERSAPSDSIPTGSLPAVSAKRAERTLDDPEAARPTRGETRRSGEEIRSIEKNVEPPRPRKTQGEASRSAASAKRAPERVALAQAPGARLHPVHPRVVAVRVYPQPVPVAPVRSVSVCFYFVVCF